MHRLSRARTSTMRQASTMRLLRLSNSSRRCNKDDSSGCFAFLDQIRESRHSRKRKTTYSTSISPLLVKMQVLVSFVLAQFSKLRKSGGTYADRVHYILVTCITGIIQLNSPPGIILVYMFYNNYFKIFLSRFGVVRQGTSRSRQSKSS